jgi:hypothetical protein
MLEASLLKFAHRVARNDFEKIAAKVEEAPRDAPVIVLRHRGELVQRSQPRVELAMSDSADRVATVTSDKSI